MNLILFPMHLFFLNMILIPLFASSLVQRTKVAGVAGVLRREDDKKIEGELFRSDAETERGDSVVQPESDSELQSDSETETVAPDSFSDSDSEPESQDGPSDENAEIDRPVRK